jgi:sugar porter (SP) family MFS transporter
VALLFSVPALGGALFGYDIGVTSFSITQMQNEEYSGVLWWHTVQSSPVWTGTIVSAVSAGALLGSFLMFLFADAIGRRTELRLGAVLYLTGAALEGWTARSEDWSGGLGLMVLMAGRLIYGVGVGITMHGAPTYLSEQSPANIRGLLVSAKEASVVFGIAMGYYFGFIFSNTVGGWGITYGMAIVPAGLIIALSFAIPESCRWLLLRGRDQEALESLSFVFLCDHAEREFELLKNSQEDADADAGAGADAGHTSFEEEGEVENNRGIWDPLRRAPLVAGVGLVILQQITGQPSVLSYANQIFHDAGLSDYSSIWVAAFKLLITLLAAVTVEKFGRKKLLYTGCSLMLVALIVLSLSFGNTSQGSQTIILMAMFVYIGGYQVGFGPISWLIISEVFPLCKYK